MVIIPRKIIPQKVVNSFYHLPIAFFANLINGFPSKGMTVIGVTGTDGKTTTTNMIYQILKEANFPVSMVSTLGARIGDKEIQTGVHITNPGPLDLQNFLKKAVKGGSKYFVLEVTSHGSDQYRVFGINFDIGVITNITHEHLDYHKNWENYFGAKAKLVENAKIAVLNRNELHFERLSKIVRGRVVSFGLTKSADFNPGKFPLKLNIPGEYNMLNALAAAAVGVNLGVETAVIKRALNEFEGLEGRMEEITNDRGLNIIVDFAHTPYALEVALKELRKNYNGKITAVFGSAGQRDVAKRALMGEVSAKLADITIITSEDPRGEVELINMQILKGAEKSGGRLGENVFIESDRKRAIEMGIKNLVKKGDVVGIFGKGHEKSLNMDGKNEMSWSDQKAVVDILDKFNG